MPHPRPRKNRKTPSYLLLSLKDPPACYSPWTPLSSHQWDNFSPPQWYTLSTPLTVIVVQWLPGRHCHPSYIRIPPIAPLMSIAAGSATTTGIIGRVILISDI